MKPVDQVTYSTTHGDCLNAAIASVLEIDLGDVPRVADGNPDDWFERLAAWTHSRGYALGHVPNDPPLKPRGYHVGVCDYQTIDGVTTGHAVVACDGVTVHCPARSMGRSGMSKPVRYWLLLMPFNQPITLVP